MNELVRVRLGGAYTINTEYALLIKSTDSDDDGQYFCRAQNSEGFGRDSLPIYIETKGWCSSIRHALPLLKPHRRTHQIRSETPVDVSRQRTRPIGFAVRCCGTSATDDQMAEGMFECFFSSLHFISSV